MTKTFSFILFTVIAFAITVSSCGKENDPLPPSTEVINLLSPDSTTIFADAGEVINLELFLATENVIDSFRAAYLIDTALIDTNLIFSQMDTTFISESYLDSSNTQSYSGSLQLPDSVTNVRMFRPYFPEQQNPFFPAQYDAVRVIFEVSAGTERFEKQLKIIIE